MTLRWTSIRFRLDIRYDTKFKGRFIPKIPFSSYPSPKFLKVTSKFNFINFSLHQAKPKPISSLFFKQNLSNI